MANWDLIGGHPAPGSPEGVETVGAAFTKLAERVDEVRGDLRQAGSRSGVGGWRGEAADAFREQISALPGELLSISVSYRQGATAMRTYAAALRREQGAANRAVGQGEVASAEAVRAERARNDAQAQIDTLDGRLRQARAQRDRAQAQYEAAPDAETRATLYPGLQSTRALVRRLDADLRTATAERDRQERARRSAAGRLEDAQGDAERVRDRIRAAAEAAVRALEQAEKEANLPGWLAREWEDAKVWVATYGPVIAESLDLGVTLFSLAAKIIPAGAPIFLTAAALCGTGAFLLNLGAMAGSPGGFTTEGLLNLSRQAVGVAISVIGVSAIARGVGIAGKVADRGSSMLARSLPVLDRVRDGIDLGEAYSKDGWSGLVGRASGMVIGEVVEIGSAAAVKRGITQMAKHPRTAARLVDASRAVAASAEGTRMAGIDVDTHTRVYQSLLGTSVYKGGYLMVEHGGAEELASHALSEAANSEAFRNVVGAAPGEAADVVVESTLRSLSQREPDDDVAITLPMRTSDRNEAS